MKYLFLSCMIAFLVPIVLSSCKENQKQISTITLGEDIVVHFPPGSITSNDAKLDTIVDPKIDAIFNETAETYKIASRLPYAIVLNLGKTYPKNDAINISVRLPKDFEKSKSPKYGYKLFAQVYQDGGMETLDYFEFIPSEYNSSSGKLTAALPRWIFTNMRSDTKEYEAVLVLATTPSENILKTGGHE